MKRLAGWTISTCPQCGQVKEREAFKLREGKFGIVCRECHNANTREASKAKITSKIKVTGTGLTKPTAKHAVTNLSSNWRDFHGVSGEARKPNKPAEVAQAEDRAKVAAIRKSAQKELVITKQTKITVCPAYKTPSERFAESFRGGDFLAEFRKKCEV